MPHEVRVDRNKHEQGDTVLPALPNDYKERQEPEDRKRPMDSLLQERANLYRGP